MTGNGPKRNCPGFLATFADDRRRLPTTRTFWLIDQAGHRHRL